jgi:hypothetical protein
MRTPALLLALAALLVPVSTGAGAPRTCAAPAYRALPTLRPAYRIDLRIAGAHVTGSSDIHFAANRPLRRLVLRLWPNGPRQSASLAVTRVTVDGKAARRSSSSPTMLVVALARPTPAGRTIRIQLRWTLRLGSRALRMNAAGGFVRLGAFFPILPWDERRGWVVDPPSPLAAETYTSPSADFDVTIHAPAGLQVVATGQQEQPGRWIARAVRDFAVAVGPFVEVSRTVDAPRPVRLTVAAPMGEQATAEAFADRASRALTALSERFGPYPWPTLSIAVMPDLGRSGIEYPNLIFQGPVSLERATTHEVAHQWFYSLVGNDQARDPWLDEGLANWAAMSIDHFESILSLPIPAAAQGRLGAPVSYWEQHPTDYFLGVYAQGPQALASLGAPSSIDCAVRKYVATEAYRIAQPADLVSALEAELPGARAKLTAYGVRTAPG